MSAPELVLRDVHVPPAPSWWPPAPGWWLVGAVAVLLVVALAAWGWWRRARRARWLALFEREAAPARLSPPQQVAALDELLRRAARRVDLAADRLQGEAWLGFLDGRRKGRDFSAGPGRALLDAPWQPHTDADVAALRALARARFVELMTGRR
ncbi:MAG: DUF4381 family protein [Pseudoxanthomonas sp.]